MLQDFPQRKQYASLIFKNLIFTTKNVNSAEILGIVVIARITI